MDEVAQRRGGVLVVLGWAHHPRKAEELFTILKETRNDELDALMKVGGRSAHIAWAEIGKRRFGVHYGIMDGRAKPVMIADDIVRMA